MILNIDFLESAKGVQKVRKRLLFSSKWNTVETGLMEAFQMFFRIIAGFKQNCSDSKR